MSVSIALLVASACVGSAISLAIDEELDEHVTGIKEYGLKWSDIGKKSHETVIVAEIITAIILVLTHIMWGW